jgi:hypothetical protein
VRFSPSLIHACIVRSYEIAVVHNCNTQQSFNIQSKAARGNSIMGTIWVENENYDLCIITTSGLEFHKFNSRADAMKLGKFYKFGPIHWYHYNHQLRALLLCSGPRRYSPTTDCIMRHTYILRPQGICSSTAIQHEFHYQDSQV